MAQETVAPQIDVNQPNAFMTEAIRLAIANVESGDGGPFAAIVVRHGEIVSRGVNLVTSTTDPTAHAEVVAIRKACQALNTFELHDSEIYTTCEPCPMCMGAIYWARLARVYFANTRADAAQAGFDDSFIYDEIARPVDSRKIPMTGLMREEALESFRVWERTQDKIRY
ncbi:MAG: nucleoside deaminase [Acidobacteriota bacterium]|nr:nucleoside deaminase [Acidobacteriota bacterium]